MRAPSRGARAVPRRRTAPPRRPFIRETTEEIACGPVELDVKMARRHGWSERAIERAWKALSAISKREGGLAHRRGPVAGCPCIVCDPRVSNQELQGAVHSIPSWRRPVPSSAAAAVMMRNRYGGDRG